MKKNFKVNYLIFSRICKLKGIKVLNLDNFMFKIIKKIKKNLTLRTITI